MEYLLDCLTVRLSPLASPGQAHRQALSSDLRLKEAGSLGAGWEMPLFLRAPGELLNYWQFQQPQLLSFPPGGQRTSK